MTRLFAIILLVAFAAAPAMKWLCERTCGAEHTVAAAEGCHHPDEAVQVVVSDRCGDHDQPVALVTKRAQAQSEPFVSPSDASAAAFVVLPVTARITGLTVLDSSPPLSGFRVPLRI